MRRPHPLAGRLAAARRLAMAEIAVREGGGAGRGVGVGGGGAGASAEELG